MLVNCSYIFWFQFFLRFLSRSLLMEAAVIGITSLDVCSSGSYQLLIPEQGYSTSMWISTGHSSLSSPPALPPWHGVPDMLTVIVAPLWLLSVNSVINGSKKGYVSY